MVQTNPVQTTQVKYTGIKNRLVYESNFSVMDGVTNYTYQPDSDPKLPRIIDTVTTDVFNNSTREEHQPNSRHQFDNIFTYGKSGLGGEHLFKAGMQWGRLYYASDYSVRLDHWLVYNNGSADRGAHLQLAGVLEERRHGHRLLHPGCVVDEPADAQPRRPL